ncbi:MAG TPA: YihY/virulence factor BrkB family protein [Vicinamibacterales bacterium]|nr:YihY/virulence factor BrkB family protein [Vicinamibacterales bacterium]
MRGERFLRRVRAELRLSGLAAWRGIVELVNGNDLTHAASIAYYALLSLFPFLLLVISLLGAVTADDADRVAVLSFVFRYFPTQLDFVTGQLDALRAARLQLGVAGSLALIWGSLGVFGAVTSAVNEAWGVEKQRSFWKHRLVSFLMLVAAGGVMMLALALVSLIQMAQATWFGAMLASYTWLTTLQTYAVRNLATSLLVIGLGLVFYFIPNAKTRFRDVWVGAVLTGLLWRLAFQGFAWYIRMNSGLKMIHGSVAAVIVFLLWVYVSSIILMYGVEFTAAYARLRRRRPDEMPAAPSPRV